MNWLECVANVSEGRRHEVISVLQRAIQSIPDALLLHADSSYDAHRTVFTFVGPEDAVVNAVLHLARACHEHIDMRQHSGYHPRIGALDVCPIIALSPEAENSAEHAVRRIATGLAEGGMGGWFYALSAQREQYRDLAEVRRGEYEGLPARATSFDFGGFDPRFGAIALGKRPFLIAYNINVKSRDLGLVREVARRIRQKTPGGLPGVKAIGWDSPVFSCSQVSCNIVNLNECSLKQLFDRVQREVHTLGSSLKGSELIGLAPIYAFRDFDRIEDAVNYLGLDRVKSFRISERILEYRLPNAPLDKEV
ncbi:MAG: hypothetical protein P8N56_06455 [Schleiferiaceae bacterium]|nr:hypothetical protein [Schleiferiaceae bacterium]